MKNRESFIVEKITTEILKKINEKNIIWFALTFIIVVMAIIVSPSGFLKFIEILERVGLNSPYSKILVFLLYLSVSILFMKPLSDFLAERKKGKKYRYLVKQIEKLPKDEFQLLIQFAVSQNTAIHVKAKYTHIARLLKAKGLLDNGWGGPDDYDGSELYIISDKLLNYLTSKYKDEIDKVRRI